VLAVRPYSSELVERRVERKELNHAAKSAASLKARMSPAFSIEKWDN